MKSQLQPRVTAKSSATYAEACNALGNVNEYICVLLI